MVPQFFAIGSGGVPPMPPTILMSEYTMHFVEFQTSSFYYSISLYFKRLVSTTTVSFPFKHRTSTVVKLEFKGPMGPFIIALAEGSIARTQRHSYLTDVPCNFNTNLDF
jgi:hypothetical protein